MFFFLMIRRPPRSTRTDTPFPYTTLFRSVIAYAGAQLWLARLLDARVAELVERLPPAVTIEAGGWQVRLHRHEARLTDVVVAGRSEEHTSELQSLMRISYAVFCLKKKKV